MTTELLIVYLIVINVVSFASFVIDKAKAARHAWRIPEASLLGLCLIGGSFGAFVAMRFVRHKTQTPLFSIGVPLLIVVNAVCVAGIIG